MSELKAYNVVATADVNPEVVDELGCTEWLGYDKYKADKVIAEKDADIDQLQAMLEERNKQVAELKNETRKAKRALWMHRAITAKMNKEACKAMREYNPFIGIEEYNWQEAERKCLKKAEEYK